MNPRETEARFWQAVGYVIELHDAATKRRVRAARHAYLEAIRLLTEAIDDARRRR